MRFLTGEVRAYDGWNEHSVICRGVEPPGHWANHPRPEQETIPVKTAADPTGGMLADRRTMAQAAPKL